MQVERLSGKVRVGWLQIFLIWALTGILPTAMVLFAIDFLGKKQLDHAKIQAFSQASGHLNRFDSLLKTEEFLQTRVLEIIRSLQKLDPSEAEKNSVVIAKIADVTPLMAIFQSRKNGNLYSASQKPADIATRTLPPKLLFKKIFEELSSHHIERDYYSQQTLSGNQRQFQQMFKTITTVTLLKNKVLRNFSTHLGGEIFFLIAEAPADSKISRAILVFRGKDIRLGTIIKNAMREVKNADLVLKTLKITGAQSHHSQFLSDNYESENELAIIRPANQLFIRNFLHDGGTKIVRNSNVIPFLRYRLKFDDLKNDLFKNRKLIKSAGLIFILLLSTLFLRLSLFGFDFSESLKKRVLAGIFLAAIFPVGTLAACLYLYHNFDQYISRLNVEQHMEIRIAQNSEQLIQQINEYETFFSSKPELLRNLYRIDENRFKEVAEKLGSNLPFSEVNLISLNEIFSHSFPERRSVFNMAGNDPIWSFFPSNIIRWLKEDGREHRVPQHVFLLAGQPVRASSLNDAMLTIGGFYLITQGTVPIMVSSVRIPDFEGKPGEISSILHLKYELGPILKSFFESRQIRDSIFFEKSGNYEIRYAFLPLKLTSNNDYWQGSLLSQDESYFAPFRHLNEPQTIYQEGSIAKIRINSGLPHKIIAVATPIGSHSSLSWSYTLILGLAFMALILWFVSLLLDQFFLLPIQAMADSAEKIARGHEDWNLQLDTGDELEALNNSFSTMITGLKQRNALKNYVSADAFSEIEKNCNIDLYPGGERLDVSVMFATIRGFDEYLHSFSPQKVIEEMNRFLGICESSCKSNYGVIDKITEKTIMMVFRPVSENVSHCLCAAKAALAIKEQLLNAGFSIQAGMASGQVISGRIGSYKGKLDFTVIGDTVNLAARLKNEASDSNTGIIVSGSAMRQLKGQARVNFLRRCSIKGKSREFNIYELLELR
ncbi:MAG: adenylate/guanylate cyclase domain-containing protein [Candidatus Rifleibacteriota bacterium]